MAYENAKNRHDELKIELDEATFDEKHRVGMDEEDRTNLLFKFAKLLSEPKLDFEMKKQYLSRAGRDPFFLGVVKIEEESDDIRVCVSCPPVTSGSVLITRYQDLFTDDHRA